MNQQPMTLEALQQRVPSAFANQAHASRSDRYAYIPSADVIRGLMQHGFQPFTAFETRSRDLDKRGYNKHMIRFRQQNAEAIVGDSVFEVVLINSHDGSSTYQLMAGVYRFVCSNGAVVADSEIGTIRVRHTGNVAAEVLAGAQHILEAAPRVASVIKSWQRLLLNGPEQQALAESALMVRFGEDGDGISAERLLMPRRSEDTANDLWHTFNRIQENTVKGGLRGKHFNEETGKTRRTRTREVGGIDQNVRLNKALWTLAEKMAALKGAV